MLNIHSSMAITGTILSWTVTGTIRSWTITGTIRSWTITGTILSWTITGTILSWTHFWEGGEWEGGVVYEGIKKKRCLFLLLVQFWWVTAMAMAMVE